MLCSRTHMTTEGVKGLTTLRSNLFVKMYTLMYLATLLATCQIFSCAALDLPYPLAVRFFFYVINSSAALSGLLQALPPAIEMLRVLNAAPLYIHVYRVKCKRCDECMISSEDVQTQTSVFLDATLMMVCIAIIISYANYWFCN